MREVDDGEMDYLHAITQGLMDQCDLGDEGFNRGLRRLEKDRPRAEVVAHRRKRAVRPASTSSARRWRG